MMKMTLPSSSLISRRSTCLLLAVTLLSIHHVFVTDALTIPTLVNELHHHVPAIQNTASSIIAQSEISQTNSNIITSYGLSTIDTSNVILSSNSIIPSISKSLSTNPIHLLSTLYTQYREALDAEPLKTKIMTGCTLAVVGDAIAQSRVSASSYDYKRAASFVAFDGCWRAVQVFTYKPLIELCNGQFSKSILHFIPYIQEQSVDLSLFAAMEQTLVSQLVLIPLIYYPVFYATTGLVQGLTLDETMTRARDTFIPLMKRNLMFWIPTQFAVFGFVEENLQIPILIACGLIWTVILSLFAGDASENEDDDSVVVATTSIDGSSVETAMAKLGAAEGAMALNGTSFYYAANVSTFYDDFDGPEQDNGNIKEDFSSSNGEQKGMIPEQQG